MVDYCENETLSFEEYYNFLTRSDLGSLYPKERFEERITKLLTTRSISITARNNDGKLIGIAFGVTDFAYYLFLTDLGVDRSYINQGIGGELLARLQEAAGGEDDITVVTIANENATGFYEKCGYVSESRLLWKPCKRQVNFEVI
ncbi:MAG: GNAT family N-acetyltransferase [Leptolyngbyaceae cyanobacterium MO_188.B28]|nr:GNAT family N-acetyltransferase [Leptolyngbyaceae cyanobacterium MO_188.B28]